MITRCYSYEFIYFFLFKKLIKFVGFITPVVGRWLIQLKSLVAAPVLFVLTCLTLTVRLLRSWWSEEVIRWQTTEVQLTVFARFFPIERMKFKKPSIKLDGQMFLSLTLYLIHFELYCLFFWMKKAGSYIGKLNKTGC